MKNSLLLLLLGWVGVAPLGAAEARTATVAILINGDSAHVSHYLPAVADSPETSAVVLADPSGRTVALARRVLGAKLVATYASAAELFAHHHADLTVISLEPRLAAPAIDAALDAGSNVLAEKPACLSTAEFDRLAAKAERKHLLLMLALANRINGDVVFARQFIQAQKLGTIYGVEAHMIADQTRLTKADYHQSWFAQKARAGGGHLIWLGIHWIDLVTYLTDSAVTDVSAFTANVGGQPLDVEDSAALTLKFNRGFLGTLTSGYYLDKSYDSHIKIWGAKGWIELNPYGGGPQIRYYTTTDAHPEIKILPGSTEPAGYTPWVAVCVRAALGLEPPPITTEESRRAIATVYAAYRAAATGKTQHLAER